MNPPAEKPVLMLLFPSVKPEWMNPVAFVSTNGPPLNAIFCSFPFSWAHNKAENSPIANKTVHILFLIIIYSYFSGAKLPPESSVRKVCTLGILDCSFGFVSFYRVFVVFCGQKQLIRIAVEYAFETLGDTKV